MAGIIIRIIPKVTQLNLILMVDNWQADKLERLAPAHWVFSNTRPGELSNKIKLQEPVVETIGAWLEEDYLPA